MARVRIEAGNRVKLSVRRARLAGKADVPFFEASDEVAELSRVTPNRRDVDEVVAVSKVVLREE